MILLFRWRGTTMICQQEKKKIICMNRQLHTNKLTSVSKRLELKEEHQLHYLRCPRNITIVSIIKNAVFTLQVWLLLIRGVDRFVNPLTPPSLLHPKRRIRKVFFVLCTLARIHEGGLHLTQV